MICKSKCFLVVLFTCLIALNSSLKLVNAELSSPTQEQIVEMWEPNRTLDYLDEVDQVRPAIVKMFIKEIPELKLDNKAILEIGSGPAGGILRYIKDPNKIVPSEPNERSFQLLKKTYPNAIQTTAQNLVQNLGGRKFDLILFTNVMDVIMNGDDKGSLEALKAAKASLKSRGRILILHYYCVDPRFAEKYINENTSQSVVFPWLERSVHDRAVFNDLGILFIDRNLLNLPFLHPLKTPFNPTPSNTLKTFFDAFLDSTSLGSQEKEAFYKNPGEVISLLRTQHGSKVAEALKLLEAMRTNKLKAFNLERGNLQAKFYPFSFWQAFKMRSEKFAKLAGLKGKMNLHRVTWVRHLNPTGRPHQNTFTYFQYNSKLISGIENQFGMMYSTLSLEPQ